MREALPVAAIRWGSIPPLLLISLAVMGSPGPATASLVAVGSVLGVRQSLKQLIGIIVGTTVVLVAVATGITAALVALPAIGSQPSRIAIFVESSDSTVQLFSILALAVTEPITTKDRNPMKVTRLPHTTFAPRRGLGG